MFVEEWKVAACFDGKVYWRRGRIRVAVQQCPCCLAAVDKVGVSGEWDYTSQEPSLKAIHVRTPCCGFLLSCPEHFGPVEL